MRPHIQYMSQLFLSRRSVIKDIIKPTASTLVLAGNNFCAGSHKNDPWLKYFSKTWENTIIVPGPLEYTTALAKQPSHINETEQLLREEIKQYNNIHFLSCTSVELPTLIVSGAKLWGKKAACEGDPTTYNITQTHQCLPDNLLWKYEESQWLKDKIQEVAYYKKPHLVVTYSVPHYSLLKEEHRLMTDHLSFYSDFEPLSLHSLPIAGWIYGAPKYAKTSKCPAGKTFIGSNAGDAGMHAFYEGMLMAL